MLGNYAIWQDGNIISSYWARGALKNCNDNFSKLQGERKQLDKGGGDDPLFHRHSGGAAT